MSGFFVSCLFYEKYKILDKAPIFYNTPIHLANFLANS